ncbi:MAG: 50S ribosomal protein L1 [Candidatus Aenigmatarchaeota archaeon]
MDIEDDLTEAVEQLKDSKERNFTQTVDLIINFSGLDLKNPENRFSSDVILPNGRGKEREVCVITEAKLSEAKKMDVNVLSKKELEDLQGEKNKAKEIAEANDYFLAEAPLMPTVGKVLGPVLGPRGKMPKPFAPNDSLEDLLGKSERSLSVKLREEPLLQLPIGVEEMEISEIADNAQAVLKEIERNLPKGSQQIGSVYLKLTMSKPVRVV